MSYAIRFLPVDPRDVSPALYLSTDLPTTVRRPGKFFLNACCVTSVASDVETVPAHWTERILHSASVFARCEIDHLRADVVPLADALADLGEP